MNTTIKYSAAGLLLLTGGFVNQAFASSVTDKASAHFNAIGTGEIAAVTADYTDKTVFLWIGGPLDGDYHGKDAITDVWKKFTKAQGPLEVQVSNIAENANPKGSTVTADVRFKGKNTVPVRYVLTYRGEKLVAETWQIDPKLGQN